MVVKKNKATRSYYKPQHIVTHTLQPSVRSAVCAPNENAFMHFNCNSVSASWENINEIPYAAILKK